MATLNQTMMLEMAKQRLQTATLPAGADKTKLLNYLPGITKAIAQAFATWQAAATLTGVQIVAVTASGGKLSGPPLEALIKASAPAGHEVLNNAIAAGVHNQMKQFEQGVKVPGLPWYPTFAAFPGPVAPPMPNVPSPLMTIAAAAAAAWKGELVKSAIVQKLPTPRPPGSEQVAGAVAAGLEMAVTMWLTTTMVKNVMGSGSVPTFAPPYVPVGAVVGGLGNMVPGGLA
jgi:hypothetical protein